MDFDPVIPILVFSSFIDSSTGDPPPRGFPVTLLAQISVVFFLFSPPSPRLPPGLSWLLHHVAMIAHGLLGLTLEISGGSGKLDLVGESRLRIHSCMLAMQRNKSSVERIGYATVKIERDTRAGWPPLSPPAWPLCRLLQKLRGVALSASGKS